jgi:hypothetical protein
MFVQSMVPHQQNPCFVVPGVATARYRRLMVRRLIDDRRVRLQPLDRRVPIPALSAPLARVVGGAQQIGPQSGRRPPRCDRHAPAFVGGVRPTGRSSWVVGAGAGAAWFAGCREPGVQPGIVRREGAHRPQLELTPCERLFLS